MLGDVTDRQTDARARTLAPVVSRMLLAITIAGSALAIGSVHTISLCVVTGVLAIAAIFAWWDAPPMHARSAATTLLVLGLVLTGYTVLQSVPMPIGWLARIAPHNADVWSRALAPLHEEGPRFAPLTLDPLATHVEALKGTAYLLAFVTALRVAKRRDGAAFLSATIVLTGLVLAAAALLHPTFGAHRVFGVYEPGPGIAGRHLAPLLNPNNLAGYLNVAFCLAFAATLSHDPTVPRAIAAAIVLFLGATQIWVASRGGVVAMALGALIVLAIARLARVQRGESVPTLSLAVGFASAVGATLVVIGGSDDASNELFQGDVSKLAVFIREMRMVPAVPWFGCGRGAFESAFPAFRADVGHITYAYPEDVVIQWIVEWGVPIGLIGLAVAGFALRPRAVLARSTTAAGAWAGVVALAVQNLGDLGSEIPGLVLAGVICAAIVVAGTPGKPAQHWVERWSAMPRRMAVAGAVAAVLGIVWVAAGWGCDLHDDQNALRAALDRHASAREMHELARMAMLRHPAEPYLPFIVSLRASHANDDNPIPWVGGTLERASIYGPAHMVLARAIATRSPSQARFEYRLAIQQWPDLVGIIQEEAARLVGSYQDAMELIPESPDAPGVIERFGLAVRERLPATRVRLDAELTARAPARPGPTVRAAEDAVTDIDLDAGPAPWCESRHWPACIDDALAKAQRAEEREPDLCEPRLLHARARAAGGEREAGLLGLELAADTVKDRLRCLQELATLARALGNVARDQAALDKVAAAGCSDDTECAGTLTWVAQQEDARGNSGKAMATYKRAYERAPQNDGLLGTIADHAARAGLHAEAAQDYGRLAKMHPGDPRWQTAEERERGAAMKAAAGL